MPAPPSHAEQRSDDATADHAFDDVEHWTGVFDNPKRDTWQKPDEVVRALGLKAGMAVADLGAGTGYFLRHLSTAVGPDGVVFAVEVETKLLDHIRKRAAAEALANVVPVLTSPDEPRLPHGRVDLVVIVDTYHHIDDRRQYLRRLARVLAPGGRVAIIDWLKRELPEGPPPDHKLAREHVLDEMRAAGFNLIEEPAFLPYQYFLIFKPETAR